MTFKRINRSAGEQTDSYEGFENRTPATATWTVFAAATVGFTLGASDGLFTAEALWPAGP